MNNEFTTRVKIEEVQNTQEPLKPQGSSVEEAGGSGSDWQKNLCYVLIGIVVAVVIIAALTGSFEDCEDEYEGCRRNNNNNRRRNNRGLMELMINQL
eukprot:snap_masked-scaffold_48-processed-gene-1.99-mRNA-1 protein AED:1.00 eAED:1.00 QI:0/-1/0/0/-1/1/1/0/96